MKYTIESDTEDLRLILDELREIKAQLVALENMHETNRLLAAATGVFND